MRGKIFETVFWAAILSFVASIAVPYIPMSGPGADVGIIKSALSMQLFLLSGFFTLLSFILAGAFYKYLKKHQKLRGFGLLPCLVLLVTGVFLWLKHDRETDDTHELIYQVRRKDGDWLPSHLTVSFCEDGAMGRKDLPRPEGILAKGRGYQDSSLIRKARERFLVLEEDNGVQQRFDIELPRQPVIQGWSGWIGRSMMRANLIRGRQTTATATDLEIRYRVDDWLSDNNRKGK